MPTSVALLLCTFFVLYLLWLERKQAPKVSHTVWVPTLWIMYCASKPLASWFGSGAEGGVEGGSSFDRTFLTVLIAAGLVVLARRKLDWAAIKKNNTWLVVLCLYALVSIAWSEYPFISIKRYIRFSGSIIMALVILSESAPGQAMERVLWRTVAVLIPFSLTLIKYYPHLGVMFGRWSGERMWVGVATQKNSLGVLCFVAVFFLGWRLLRARQEARSVVPKFQIHSDLSLLLIALYLLKGPPNAYSASAIIVLALGSLSLLSLFWMQQHGRRLGPKIFLAAVVCLYLYGFGVPFGLRAAASGFLQIIGRDATFTGRNEIWEELIPVALHNPILGCGYGGFWVRPIESGVNEAHNGYLDVMLELGVVGLFLLLVFLISSCRAFYAALRHDFWWAVFGLSYLLMTLLHNASNSTFLKTSDFLWTLLICLKMMMPGRVRVETAVEGQAVQSLSWKYN